MLSVGRNAPPVLLVLFTGWILIPFVLVFAAVYWPVRWLTAITATVQIAALIMSIISTSVYGYFAVVAQPKTPTAIFVVVPPISLGVFIAALVAAKVIYKGRRSDT